ncbi:hypothetical protein L6R29_15400 [Myxococcota bacterium]|nr:hypothetical protein [Myxococcota bacterium]
MAKKTSSPSPKAPAKSAKPPKQALPPAPPQIEELDEDETWEDDTPPDEQTLAKAWKALEKQIKAHEPSSRRLFTRPLSAVRQTLKIAQQALADRERFALLHKDLFDINLLDTLETRALAFWHAEIVWRRFLKGTPFPNLDTFLKEMLDLRAEILKATLYLWEDHPTLAPLVADIQKGRGREDAADDLVRLADLWKNHWKEAEGRSKITLDMIQRAANDGARFLAHLDKQPTPTQLQQAALLRQKAWSFLDQALTEVVDTGRYLFRKQDPLTRYPSLQNSPSSKKTSPPTPQPTPTPPTT